MALTRIGSVGLSTGIDINAGVGTFTGNLTVGGVLTYEDVTNVDSIGLITARNGVVVGSGITLSSDGDIFFTGIMTGNGSGLSNVGVDTAVVFTDKITLPDSSAGSINVGLGSDLQIYWNGSAGFLTNQGGGNLHVNSDTVLIKNAANNKSYIRAYNNSSVELYHNNSKTLETASGGVTVTGKLNVGTAATLDASGLSVAGIVTATDIAPTVGQLSHRNKVINGAMAISQRIGGASIQLDATEVYTVDRFKSDNGSSFDMKADASQVEDHPHGFTYSLKLQCDGVSTPSADQNGGLSTFIEGQDVQDFSFGNSGAKPITVSFYAKSSTQNSGDTYGFMLGYSRASDSARVKQTRSFTVTDTWQRFEFTFQPNGQAQSSAIVNSTAYGLQLFWSLAAGSNDLVSEITTWTAAQALVGVTGQDNFFDQVSNQFYLTGVQVEIGNKATPFEHRSFHDDLQSCFRYYRRFGANGALPTPQPYNRFALGYSPTGGGSARFTLQLDPPMRINPVNANLTTSGSFNTQPGNSGGNSAITVDDNSCNVNSMTFFCAGLTSMSTGYAVSLLADNDTTAFIAMDADY